jgi:transcriptional regulator with XRE-family HTH domain
MSIPLITSSQIRAGRHLANLSQPDIAKATGLSLPTIRRAESERKVSVSADAISAIRTALEAAGVEFTNGNQPGVRMKSYKLKDAGLDVFLMGPVAKWVGFGALDAGRKITVRVEDIALQRLEPASGGADHRNALRKHRSKVFTIAAEKYERGIIEPDGSVSVTYADVSS